MGYLKKSLALIIALAMVLSITVTSASAFSLTNLFSKDKYVPAVSACDIISNIEKGIQGTGLVYGRDYKVQIEADDTFGYRIHLIQPVSGNTLYDNYLLYKDGAWTWEKEWNLPTIPTIDQFNIENIKNNIYTTLWDSGIYVDLDEDITVTRESEDGFKVLIIDPLTGREIYNKEFVIEDEKTISWSNEFEPIAEDSILAAHFPTTDEAEEEMIEEQEEIVEEIQEETPIVEEEVEEIVINEATPLGDTEVDEIANTGDTAFSAMVGVCTLAGAAFVISKKVK